MAAFTVSFKNQLQELVAKNEEFRNYRIVYDSNEVVDADYKHLGWQSSCHLSSSSNTLTFTGKMHCRKIDSDCSAAEAAIEHIHKRRYTSNTVLVSKISSLQRRLVVLVDLENVQKTLDEAYSLFADVNSDPKVFFIFFYSERHPINEEKYTSIRNFKFIRIPSSRKDAADVGLCFYLGYHLGITISSMVNYLYHPIEDIIPDYHILTKDHFADVLRECVMGYHTIIHSSHTLPIKCEVHVDLSAFIASL